MMQIKSTVPSFKSNRFNSLFVGGASLHFHRLEIAEFLQSYMCARNQKLESVLQGAISEDVNIFVVALAMMYYHVMGPYWQLLCAGKTLCAEFHIPVAEMHTQLKEWARDSTSAFLEITPSLFNFPHDFEERSLRKEGCRTSSAPSVLVLWGRLNDNCQTFCLEAVIMR